MRKEKGVLRSRIWAAALLLLWLNGCAATGPSSLGGILSPKKKVPPLEEMTLPPPPGQRAGAAAAPQPAAQPAGQPSEAGMTAEPPPAAPAPQPRLDPALFSGMTDYVSGRINHYRDLQSRWQELESGLASREPGLPEPEKWQKCTESIGSVLDGYFSLHNWLASRGSEVDERRQSSPFQVFQQDIAFSEGDCPQLFVTTAAVMPGELRAARGLAAGREEAAVRYWAQRGDNGQVISAYENLTAAGQEKNISPETRELYAKALRASGKFVQAAEALLAAAAQYHDEWRAWPLRLQAAELLFATGEFARARSQYEQVAALFAKVRSADGEVEKQLSLLGGEAEHGPELTLYSKALHGLLQFDGGHVPPELAESVQQLEAMYPGSNYARLARELLAKAGGPAARSVDEALSMARELAAEKKFSEALELLAPYSKAAEPGSEAAAPVKALEEEIRNQQAAQAGGEQSAQQGILDAKWQKAQQSLDQRQYDQAITLFSEFADPPYQEQAKGKIIEAMNLAAAELRKEAASLFVKARKSASIEQKSALLAESRRLLVLIQEKYPQADIIDKVKQNQKAIDEQLMALNPRQQQGE